MTVIPMFLQVWAVGLAAQNCSQARLVEALRSHGYHLRISGADTQQVGWQAGNDNMNALRPSDHSSQLFEIEARLHPDHARAHRHGATDLVEAA